MTTIKIEHLNKHFHKQSGLNDINLTFESNQIYGLLGRNGAGKSTLLNIITDRIFANSGQVKLDGAVMHDNGDALSKVFMMSQDNLYQESTKVQNIIKTTAAVYDGFDQHLANELIQKFDVNVKTKFGKLSTGYHSIVKLIIALCVPAEVVIFDEPTLGLDANHRELFYSELIQSYSDNPRTFIISTHLIDEVANIVSDVAIIDHGAVIVSGDNESVLKNAHTITGPERELDQYCAGLNVIGSKHLGNLKTNYVYGPLNDDQRIPDTVSVESLDLQTLFIYLTKRKGELENDE
ncbi:ABC transporter ATP-binding protein [Lactobacillus sp. Sy-1]|uniref:ATP-binding cassette domain-containing protein n=1 Tax=Lactobacillus sp. Sy-1 TaxID=2109645 RepID=UPI001C5A75C0|nr:ABC transporter ATP-binding protein [Lactobacillus sp. Sy-1]MBW1605825.1 ABC transporter ATP-binding protein [Lactobacillus sp. Sy-1]